MHMYDMVKIDGKVFGIVGGGGAFKVISVGINTSNSFPLTMEILLFFNHHLKLYYMCIVYYNRMYNMFYYRLRRDSTHNSYIAL